MSTALETWTEGRKHTFQYDKHVDTYRKAVVVPRNRAYLIRCFRASRNLGRLEVFANDWVIYLAGRTEFYKI